MVAPNLARITSWIGPKVPEILEKSRETMTAPRTAAGDTNEAKVADANPAKVGDKTLAEAGGTTRPNTARRNTAKADRHEVRMGGMCLVAPTTWTRERPPINFLVAQFRLLRAKGDGADAQLTVAAVGESTPRSLARLREQLKQDAEEGSVENLQIAGNEVIMVDSSGDGGSEEASENDGHASGPSAPPASVGRYRVLNAMVFVGGKVYVVNCSGPERTVGERAGEVRAFLQTMKPADKS